MENVEINHKRRRKLMRMTAEEQKKIMRHKRCIRTLESTLISNSNNFFLLFENENICGRRKPQHHRDDSDTAPQNNAEFIVKDLKTSVQINPHFTLPEYLVIHGWQISWNWAKYVNFFNSHFFHFFSL